MPSINVNDTASPRLQAIHQAVGPGGRLRLMRVLGRGLEGDLRKHFAARDTEPNRRGWPKSHFWAGRIRTATTFTGATDSTSTVSISDPAFGARLDGATIRSPDGKKLSVPLTAEAASAGMPSAKRLPGVFLLRTKSGRAFLVRRNIGHLDFLWILRDRVRHPKDPRALPPSADLAAAAERRAEDFINRLS